MQPASQTDAPTASIQVPLRFALERPNAVEIAALLRGRLLLVSVLIAGTVTFFASYRALSPGQWQFFRSSAAGTALLALEAGLWVLAVGSAAGLWRRRSWSLARLRRLEFTLILSLGLYVGWSQLIAWAGSRFALDGSAAALDPFILRQAIDSMAARWVALIVGVSTLIPETPRRNAALVGILAATAMALTGYVGLTDSAYRPHLGVMLAVMGFWMTLAGTIGIFGSYKLAELRRQVQNSRQLGQYRLVRRIGAGSMGEVHLAEHLLLKQPCAIKLIRPERAADAATLSLFEQEVQATARLNHWNTVRIYDYGYTTDGTFYYVMEYLSGWTLEQLVLLGGPIGPARTVHLLRQVCAALREAHAIGLVHRDIKPANIITCCRGGVSDLVKLLDFGLVRRVAPHQGHLIVTRPGMLTGTPAYMSPEQANAEPADERSDIYSLGAVAYFLVTGQAPFVRPTAMQVLIAHVSESPVPPRALQPAVPADLEAIIMRCLSKTRDDRFADVLSFERALSGCSAAGGWTEDDADQWWRRHVPPETHEEAKGLAATVRPAPEAMRASAQQTV